MKLRSGHRLATVICAVGITTGAVTIASAEEIKIGVLLGYTGPIESLIPDIDAAAKLAIDEVNNAGGLLDGQKVAAVEADSTCIDADAATAAAERLVTSDGVAAIMGADCSGVTTAVANNVAVPNGVVMISPSATSPGLTTIEDNGYFFRTAPSDARQGEIIRDVLMDQGIDTVAVTYTNNDYGKGLADSFQSAFEAAGGSVLASVPHEDGKADYSAEVAALAATGAEHLGVFGYIDQGGKGIIQASLDSGAFSNFFMADGMVGDVLFEAFGEDIEGAILTLPGSESAEAAQYSAYAEEMGLKGDCPFCSNTYDATALILLAIEAAGSADRSAIQSKILDVANAPGEKIGPNELGRALALIREGVDIDYVGGTGVELDDVGDSFGSYKELRIEGGEFVTVRVR